MYIIHRPPLTRAAFVVLWGYMIYDSKKRKYLRRMYKKCLVGNRLNRGKYMRKTGLTSGLVSYIVKLEIIPKMHNVSNVYHTRFTCDECGNVSYTVIRKKPKKCKHCKKRKYKPAATLQDIRKIAKKRLQDKKHAEFLAYKEENDAVQQELDALTKKLRENYVYKTRFEHYERRHKRTYFYSSRLGISVWTHLSR